MKSSKEPLEGRWHWVRLRYRRHEGDSDWFPALRAAHAAGGWTNQDCWEDFDKEVVEWRLIPMPFIEQGDPLAISDDDWDCLSRGANAQILAPDPDEPRAETRDLREV